MAMKPFTLRSPEAVFRFISPITSRYPHSPLTAILSKVPSLRNSVEDEVQRICYRAMKYLRSIQNIHSSMSEYFFDADLMDM
ncbi:hypothetical protein G9P44_003582 [Scheffersomyces stipitis]|nr:hypothetical protein G9P44_003582 [Scheffersomyces stipitis]